LHDQIRTCKRDVGPIEQHAEDRGGGPEWNAAHHPELLGGRSPGGDIGAHNLDTSGFLLAREQAEMFGPNWVDLDGYDLGATTGESLSERTRASADIDYQLTWHDIRLGNEALSSLGAKEVLPETTTSFVSGCPSAGGHDVAPR
jgi:hypothetical protein